MTRFINEHLEVYSDHRGDWYRCAHCEHVLCSTSEDWREACLTQRVPPKKEPIISDLLDTYWFLQQCCTSCGALIETNLITREGEVIR